MAKPIVISILSNHASAVAGLNETATTAERVGSKFQAMAVPATAALAVIGVGAKRATDAASDLGEEASKSGEIFGEQTAEIRKFAQDAEQALGQSERAALDATSTFGQIAQKAGLGADASADFAQKFTGLASDLASFNNTTPEEAITAIGAALRGESEPIRQYGVMLDDATLRNRALTLGLIDNVKTALTPQQKALAASEEILAQTTKAQGDFARTADGAANKSRINAAATENLSAKLGTQLLPYYEKLLQVLGSVLDWMSKHETTTKVLIATVAALAAMVLTVNAAMKVTSAATVIYTTVLGTNTGAHKASLAATVATRTSQAALAVQTAVVSTATKAYTAAMAAGAAVQRTVAAAAIGTRIGLAALAIQTAVVSTATKAYTGAMAASAAVQRAVAAASIGTRLALLALTVQTIATSAATKAAAAAQWLLNAALTANPIGLIIAAVALLVAGLVWFFTQTEIGQKIVAAAWEGLKVATQVLVDAVLFYVNLLVAYWQMVWSGVKWVVDKIVAYYTFLITKGFELYNGIVGAFSAAVEWVKGVPGKITSALGDLGSLLKDAGKKVIDGFVNGLEKGWDKVKTSLGNLTSKLTDWKGPAERDRLILNGAGRLVVDGFITGLESRYGAAKKSLNGFTDDIAKTTVKAPSVNADVLRGETLSDDALARSMGGVVVHKTVKVEVQMLDPTVEAGRVIARSLQEYERVGGAV